MSALGTEKLVKFSNKLMKRVYVESIFDAIVNRDYEGEVADAQSLKIGGVLGTDVKTYSGSVSYDDPNEFVTTFTPDQYKYVAFKLKDKTQYDAFIKNPKGMIWEQNVIALKAAIDTYVLGFYGDVAAGKWVGTDYTTGTVTVDVTTGAVTGSGTTFTAAMVGKPFKATGHSQWYRVKTYTSATAITIEDDLDDVASQYSGGAIAAGATYVIQANTAITLTANTISANLLALREKLGTKVPMSGRFVIVPPAVETLILQASILTPYTDAAFEWVQRGGLGMIHGFSIIVSDLVPGDNTNGYHIIAGTKEWLTFADAVIQSPEEIRLETDFATGYRQLNLWGAKVADERRMFAAKLFAKV